MLLVNEGTWDRALRVLVGLALAALGTRLLGAGQIVVYALAALALVTGVAGRCPLYSLLGLRTRPLPGQR